MKRILAITIVATMVSVNASAQSKSSDWTLNTRAWSTNYWTSLIYGVVESSIKVLVKDNETDSLIMERVLPDPSLVFPVGISKSGFNGVNDIYGPYHRAFGNPIKHIGDYAIGLDASWRPCVIGAYCGAYFKSQEIVFKQSKDNLRGFYVQPRAGVILGNKKNTFEAGAFYDVVTDAGGSLANASEDMLKGGWGLDFALSHSDKKGRSQTFLQFSMPLHNFIDSDYPGFAGMKRKVGYISICERISF